MTLLQKNLAGMGEEWGKVTKPGTAFKTKTLINCNYYVTLCCQLLQALV